jgi:hypothetical protein
VKRRDEQSARSALGRLDGSSTLPTIRNEMADGILWRMRLGSPPDAAFLFPEWPGGFADSEHYYTFSETPEGLIRIVIHRFTGSCSPM